MFRQSSLSVFVFFLSILCVSVSSMRGGFNQQPLISHLTPSSPNIALESQILTIQNELRSRRVTHQALFRSHMRIIGETLSSICASLDDTALALLSVSEDQSQFETGPNITNVGNALLYLLDKGVVKETEYIKEGLSIIAKHVREMNRVTSEMEGFVAEMENEVQKLRYGNGYSVSELEDGRLQVSFQDIEHKQYWRAEEVSEYEDLAEHVMQNKTLYQLTPEHTNTEATVCSFFHAYRVAPGGRGALSYECRASVKLDFRHMPQHLDTEILQMVCDVEDVKAGGLMEPHLQLAIGATSRFFH
ncbi:hypothetical protein B0O99DRAFT_742177 [Bisporella sp. PMI_857]|nr:hypothetical protein B0O99DRAFT_742177 [Bisporella sp. PMI_857]